MDGGGIERAAVLGGRQYWEGRQYVPVSSSLAASIRPIRAAGLNISRSMSCVAVIIMATTTLQYYGNLTTRLKLC